MKSFWAIVKLTFRNAIRSHIFQLLLLVLLLCVLLIPSTVSGDGTAGGFIRISLLYSLSAVSTVLALSSIWLGCHAMTQDIDSYQLHMVVTKPVSRVKIWFAKWVGVYLVHLVLLLLAGTTIYFIILYKYNEQEFSPAEREKIRNEVMVGRRVFMPDPIDYDGEARKLLKEKLDRLAAQNRAIDTSMESQEKMLREARQEVMMKSSEFPFGGYRQFRFSGIPHSLNKPLYLRYRPYVGKVATEGQRMTRSDWLVGVPKITEKKPESNVFEQGPGYEVYPMRMTEQAEQVMAGEFHEKVLQKDWQIITPDDTVIMYYGNMDDAREKQYLQPADGPMLLVEVSGFFENYLRAVLVVALELLILCGLGCAFGGILTLPTAIFVVISYLLFGSFAVYMANLSYVATAADQVGQFIARLLLFVVIPLQAFEVTGQVANGEIIEFTYIWMLFKSFFIYRALPLFALGILLYRRRELGLVIRK